MNNPYAQGYPYPSNQPPATGSPPPPPPPTTTTAGPIPAQAGQYGAAPTSIALAPPVMVNPQALGIQGVRGVDTGAGGPAMGRLPLEPPGGGVPATDTPPTQGMMTFGPPPPPVGGQSQPMGAITAPGSRRPLYPAADTTQYGFNEEFSGGATSGFDQYGPSEPHAPPLFQQHAVSPQQNLLDGFYTMPITPAQPGAPGAQIDISKVPWPSPLRDDVVPETTLPRDQPNIHCYSGFVRTTVRTVPSSSSARAKSHLSFGAVVQPLAVVPTEHEPPVVNFGPSRVIRCLRCRTYINPFVQFSEGGRRWRCNLCGLLNDVPTEYFCNLDADGRRRDLYERPELMSCSVEFIAPAEYMVRPPQPPVYFFVIDVSYSAVASGMLKIAAETIKETLDKIPGDSRTQIGFLTFDSTVHFYDLKSSLSQPQMLIVPDVENIFLPLPDDMLVNLTESRTVVDALVDRLPTMFEKTESVESALGPALRAAAMVMKKIGGKMLVFQATLPSSGIAKLRNREDIRLLGTEKERLLLLPEDEFYKNMSVECCRYQICVDLFLFSGQFTDVATLSALPRYCGGELHHYPGFQASRDSERFRWDLQHVLSRPTGFEAVMRIRCSRGLRISHFYGHFFTRSTDLLSLPNVDCDKAFSVQIAHEENLLNSTVAFIQCALLYTTTSGERRIRVHTHPLPVSGDLSDVFKSADMDAMMNLISKRALEVALSSKLQDARSNLEEKCFNILRSYRSLYTQHFKTTNELVLPDSLKLLPLYMNSMVKSVVFRGGTDVRPDERAYYISRLETMPASVSATFFYPRLFALHNLPPDVGLPGSDGQTVMPSALHLSAEKLEADGCYLLDNGLVLYFWISRSVSSEFLQHVLGLESVENVDMSLVKLLPYETDLSVRIRAIVDAIRKNQGLYQPLYFMKQGDPLEGRFFAHLVEDRTMTAMSYLEFLVHSHQQVLSKVP